MGNYVRDQFHQCLKVTMIPIYQNMITIQTWLKRFSKQNGWEDKNGDGIIENGNVEFSFDLYISTGNPRRNYVATIVKNNLKAVGIEANIQTAGNGCICRKINEKGF